MFNDIRLPVTWSPAPGSDDAPTGFSGQGVNGNVSQRSNTRPNSSEAQRARLLAALHVGPVTTFDARRPPLDIAHPAACVRELREEAENVLTYWSREVSDLGRLHRIAVYVLVGGGV